MIDIDGAESSKEEIVKQAQPELQVPIGWECKKHDKSLLKAANEKGLEIFG